MCHMGRKLSVLMWLMGHKGSVFIKWFHWNQIRQCVAAEPSPPLPPSRPASNPKRRTRGKNGVLDWSLTVVITGSGHFLSLCRCCWCCCCCSFCFFKTVPILNAREPLVVSWRLHNLPILTGTASHLRPWTQLTPDCTAVSPWFAPPLP